VINVWTICTVARAERRRAISNGKYRILARVFAAILTYNRKALLAQCLDAVFAQTHACDEVMVIDNGSTDDTAAMLLSRAEPGLQFHVLSQNIGASGGFNAALRLAYQQGADYVWLMDDDVIPAPTALAHLLDADALLTARQIPRAFVLSTAWTEGGEVTNVPRIDTRPNRNGYESWPSLLEQKMVPVTRATFVSILLPRATIAAHGLPLAPMFIWGEDSEYTLRVTRECPGYVVAESKVVHLRALAGVINIVTENNMARIKYHRHLIRNQMYTARKYYPRLDFMRHVVRQLQQIGRLMKAGQWRKVRIAAQGMFESLWFAPRIEAADAPIASLGVTVVASNLAIRPDQAPRSPSAHLNPALSGNQKTVTG
jgi:GT2 family glycosyltransferase